MRCVYLMGIYDGRQHRAVTVKPSPKRGLEGEGYDATCHHTDCTVTHKFQRLLQSVTGEEQSSLTLTH